MPDVFTLGSHGVNAYGTSSLEQNSAGRVSGGFEFPGFGIFLFSLCMQQDAQHQILRGSLIAPTPQNLSPSPSLSS